MFVELITNYDTNKRRLIRISDIDSITYDGKKVIRVKLKPEANMKTKSFGLHYPSEQVAADLYMNLAQALGVVYQF